MKWSQVSELAEVKLECSCGKIYTGKKLHSHDFIKEHKACEPLPGEEKRSIKSEVVKPCTSK